MGIDSSFDFHLGLSDLKYNRLLLFVLVLPPSLAQNKIKAMGRMKPVQELGGSASAHNCLKNSDLYGW